MFITGDGVDQMPFSTGLASFNPAQSFDAKIQSYKESEQDYQIEDPIVIPIGKFGNSPSRWEYAFLPTIVDEAPQNE
jgi:hypothetical protein